MKRVVLALALLFGLASPAVAAPKLELVGTRGRITVYAEEGIEDIASNLAQDADATLIEISGDLPDLPVPQHVELRIVRSASDLAAIAPPGRGAPSYAIGVAYPDLGILSLALRKGPDQVDPVFTLRHELAHLALGAALAAGEGRARVPHWLHEGFAYQHSPEYSRERVETLAGMAWLGNEIPLDQLDGAFPAGELPAHRAYAESYDFVGFLANRGRWEDTEDDGNRFPFRKFLWEIGHGATVDTAAIRSFGRPISALFEEWRIDLQRRYQMLPVGLIGFALWIMVALLLVYAWWRRRRQNKKRVAQWEADDVARRERERNFVLVPPYVPWPGEGDPLATEPPESPDPDDDKGPRLLN